jgi:hypothetical protein
MSWGFLAPAATLNEMKKFWEAIIVVIVAIVVYFLFFGSRQASFNLSPAQNGTVSGIASNAPAAPPVDAQNTPRVANAAPSNAPDQLASHAASPNSAVAAGTETNTLPDLPPLTVLDKARVVIHNYHDAFGENPVGTNPEITAALKGKNPKQINFVKDSGLRSNDKGEMVDGYGTPFFFHQISGQEMEIRSAGPDRTMWTRDDLVTK